MLRGEEVTVSTIGAITLAYVEQAAELGRRNEWARRRLWDSLSAEAEHAQAAGSPDESWSAELGRWRSRSARKQEERLRTDAGYGKRMRWVLDGNSGHDRRAWGGAAIRELRHSNQLYPLLKGRMQQNRGRRQSPVVEHDSLQGL